MRSAAEAAKHDPTSPFVREVIDLYGEEAFAQVRFPDVDCEMLLAAQRALRETQLELERCEAQLAAAREALAAQLEAIEGKAERALAYARVYATGDPELSARLEEIGRRKPASTSERAPPKRRGRPKQSSEGAELFAEPAPAADGGATAPLEEPLPVEETPPVVHGHAKRKREREAMALTS